MKKKIQKIGFVLVLTIFVNVLFAEPQQPPLPQTSDDFRVNVVADSHSPMDRLNLTLELLNNSSTEIVLSPQEQAPDETQILPDEPADGEPNMPPIIGVARLIPLRVPPPQENEQQPETEVQEGSPMITEVPLRLLGGPVITGHSTVVISIASMPLNHGPAPEENGQEALNQEDATEENDEPMGIRPGLYLLDCGVNAIEGIAEIHAETIIRIPLPPPSPHDNGRRPNQANRPQH